MTSVYSPYIERRDGGCRQPERRGHESYASRAGGRLGDAVNIEQFLRDSGFDTPTALRRARSALESAGLTHAGKQAFVATKVDAASDLLRTTLLRVCGDSCLEIDRRGAGRAREAVIVTQEHCEICNGSNNRRSAIAFVRALRHRGISRIVIVGGTPHQWQEMKALLQGAELELKYVDGTKASHTAKDALAHRRWAQLIVVWGPTPLRHAVSDLYTEEPLPHLRIVSVSRRSVGALYDEVTRSFT